MRVATSGMRVATSRVRMSRAGAGVRVWRQRVRHCDTSRLSVAERDSQGLSRGLAGWVRRCGRGRGVDGLGDGDVAWCWAVLRGTSPGRWGARERLGTRELRGGCLAHPDRQGSEADSHRDLRECRGAKACRDSQECQAAGTGLG